MIASSSLFSSSFPQSSSFLLSENVKFSKQDVHLHNIYCIFTRMQQKKNSNYEKVLSFTFIKIKLIKKVKTLFDSKFYADSEYVIVFYKNVN